jgi:hypothetical protein
MCPGSSLAQRPKIWEGLYDVIVGWGVVVMIKSWGHSVIPGCKGTICAHNATCWSLDSPKIAASGRGD